MDFSLLTEDQLKKFEELGAKSQHSTTWSSEQIADAYIITNILYGLNKSDTGCTSCRRGTIDLLKKAYRTKNN